MASDFTLTQLADIFERWVTTILKRTYLFVRRTLTTIGPLIGLYIVVGSCMYGEWWYGFFWDRGFKNARYLSEAVDYVLTDQIVLSIALVVALFITIVCLTLLKRKILPFIDRFAWLVLLSVVAVVVLDALVLRKTEAESYRLSANADRALDDINAMLRRLLELDAPPKIEPPLYFHYLDESRIAALYNQIEPELEEKQREVTRSSNVKGKANLGVDYGGVGIEGGSENQRKSTLNPPESSPDRKSIGIMKYVRETWPENYFTTENDYYSRKMGEERERKRKAMIGTPVTKSQIESLRLDSSKEIEQQIKGLHDQLGRELSAIRGLVFVDGEFTRSESADKIFLVRNFSKKPSISFRVSLPKRSANSIPSTKPLRLRVFGDIVRPLGEDGYIEVAGIAVF